uniref:GCR007 n=1 Tax=Schmidtea mediterranea TaxID=79327 RepID=A0A193KUD7_SCHMD|nr:GCR007 [Schmidtea mediterranea]
MINSTFNPSLENWEIVLGSISAILIIFITIVGNILVILSVIYHRPLRKVQNFLIISLAAADLSVASLVMPFALINYILGRWIFGSVLCDFWLTSDVFCCTASILNLCAIALDRYWAINYPLDYVNKRTIRTILSVICGAYILSGLISIPPLLGWKEEMKNLYVCSLSDNRIYVLFSAFGSFIIPTVVIFFVYIRIYFAIRKRLRDKIKFINQNDRLLMKKETVKNKRKDSKENSSLENETCKITPTCSNKVNNENTNFSSVNNSDKLNQFWNERQKISLSKERKSARTMGIIMGVFVICWSPFFLMYVIVPFCSASVCQNRNQRVEVFLVWLGYVPKLYEIFTIRLFSNQITGEIVTYQLRFHRIY